ncbi:S66 peptidase family protein [Sunxiuqinia elliptica]|uniref:Muramoyltetrapeptide carboxypeptidase n=1 Tax=Sunxiuqinia elliptica TaxID=655355 RepID=A0A1I2BP61_9BACT|nr:LD-carboxypeptidase [Sunxiuqinia elliptica]SFE57859.1 muramoyltetrapeptide carboxypeptidase [Sunxiuqinia elliptica]
MQQANFLKTGDRIRIVSPAGKVPRQKIEAGVELLQKEGFDIRWGEHVFDSHFQFASTDEQRLKDLQEALDDPDCKAIICSRGGYGAIRLVDQLDFSNFRKHPKWLVGFSDITILHAKIQQEGFCSIHGAMPGFYLREEQPTESFAELVKVLRGQAEAISVPAHNFNREGKGQGLLVGGNLSILYSLLGTPLQANTKGDILFIEDLSEYLYHLDRIMHSLKLAGKLEYLHGLVVGGFTEMKDNDSPFGQTAYEIIQASVQDYDYPVCFDFPAGHIERNLPLILGANYTLAVGENEAKLYR